MSHTLDCVQWQIAVSVSEGSLTISVTSLVRQQGGSGARPQVGGARVDRRAPPSGPLALSGDSVLCLWEPRRA